MRCINLRLTYLLTYLLIHCVATMWMKTVKTPRSYEANDRVGDVAKDQVAECHVVINVVLQHRSKLLHNDHC